MSLKSHGRRGLVEETYSTLKERILRHAITPGQHVTIDSIARELQVSQTPVREALIRLEADGLMENAPNKGYSVASLLDPDGYSQLFDFRLLIEPWAAGEATERSSSSAGVLESTLIDARTQLALVESNARSGRGGGLDTLHRVLSEHSAKFHSLVTGLSLNKYLVNAYEDSHFHLHLFRLYLAARSAAAQTEDLALAFDQHYSVDSALITLESHKQIADAIASGSSAKARDLTFAHLEKSRERSMLVLEIVTNQVELSA